jgi:hypothetical protein
MKSVTGIAMPTISENRKDLLAAVKQMAPEEFDAFIEKAFAIRRSTRAARLSAEETKLIEFINCGLPVPLSKRYAELSSLRKATQLSERQHEELLRLTHEAETCDAERAAALLKLSKLRRVPVRTLMKQMGIRTPAIHG